MAGEEEPVSTDAVVADADAPEKAAALQPEQPQAEPSPPQPESTGVLRESSLVIILIEQYNGGEEEGLPSGSGKARFAGGHVYDGEWVAGKMHGAGAYRWAHGVVYTGEFAENELTGQGSYAWPDGSSYQGSVKEGLRHGLGMFLCDCSADDGGKATTYMGGWEQGERSGEGALEYADGAKYEGGWEGDCRSGQGTMVYASGNKYVGGWLNDLKDGEGSMYWLSLRQHYTGGWGEGRQHGVGTHVWATEEGDASPFQMYNRYEGEFAAGARSGTGIFHYASGAVYAGGWAADLKQGDGLYTGEDGTIVKGAFDRDRMISSTPVQAKPTGGPLSQMRLDIAEYIEGCHPFNGGEDAAPKQLNAEMRRVLHCFLRHSVRLKEVYKHYAKLQNPDTEGGDAAFSMNMGSFALLAKAAKLPCKNMSLAEMHRCVHATATQGLGLASALEITGHDDPYDSSNKLLFRELCEALARAACAKYGGGGLMLAAAWPPHTFPRPADTPSSAREAPPTASECCEKLLLGDVLPLVTADAARAEGVAIEEPTVSSLHLPVQSVPAVGVLGDDALPEAEEEEEEEELSDEDAAALDAGLAETFGRSQVTGTMTVQELCTLLESVGVVGPADAQLSRDELVRTVVAATYGGADISPTLSPRKQAPEADYDYLSSDLVLSEYRAVLAALARSAKLGSSLRALVLETLVPGVRLLAFAAEAKDAVAMLGDFKPSQLAEAAAPYLALAAEAASSSQDYCGPRFFRAAEDAATLMASVDGLLTEFEGSAAAGKGGPLTSLALALAGVAASLRGALDSAAPAAALAAATAGAAAAAAARDEYAALETTPEGEPEPEPELDEEGNPKLDEEGNPVYKEQAAAEPAPKKEYKTEEGEAKQAAAVAAADAAVEECQAALEASARQIAVGALAVLDVGAVAQKLEALVELASQLGWALGCASPDGARSVQWGLVLAIDDGAPVPPTEGPSEKQLAPLSAAVEAAQAALAEYAAQEDQVEGEPNPEKTAEGSAEKAAALAEAEAALAEIRAPPPPPPPTAGESAEALLKASALGGNERVSIVRTSGWSAAAPAEGEEAAAEGQEPPAVMALAAAAAKALVGDAPRQALLVLPIDAGVHAGQFVGAALLQAADAEGEADVGASFKLRDEGAEQRNAERTRAAEAAAAAQAEAAAAAEVEAAAEAEKLAVMSEEEQAAYAEEKAAAEAAAPEEAEAPAEPEPEAAEEGEAVSAAEEGADADEEDIVGEPVALLLSAVEGADFEALAAGAAEAVPTVGVLGVSTRAAEKLAAEAAAAAAVAAAAAAAEAEAEAEAAAAAEAAPDSEPEAAA